MRRVLKKLIEFLPLSRRKHAESLKAIATVIEGLVEAEANHCQIETNLIMQFQAKSQPQKDTVQKPETKKNGSDPAFA